MTSSIPLLLFVLNSCFFYASDWSSTDTADQTMQRNQLRLDVLSLLVWNLFPLHELLVCCSAMYLAITAGA